MSDRMNVQVVLPAEEVNDFLPGNLLRIVSRSVREREQDVYEVTFTAERVDIPTDEPIA